MQRLREAAHYCQMDTELVGKEQPTMLPRAYYEYARVCYQLKDYRRSLELLQKGVEACESNNAFAAIVDIYELMARNYEQLGQAELALKYLKQARDSADVANSQAQQHLMNERNIVVDMMEKEQEISLREAQMLMMRRTVAALVVVVALLVVLLLVVIKNSRRRTQLYHNIVQQNKQALEREKELKQQIEKLSLHSASETPPSETPPLGDAPIGGGEGLTTRAPDSMSNSPAREAQASSISGPTSTRGSSPSSTSLSVRCATSWKASTTTTMASSSC